MGKDFKKYEIISFLFFINACTWPFLDNTKIIILGMIFNSTYSVNIIITLAGLILFTAKAMYIVNTSKIKKNIVYYCAVGCLFYPLCNLAGNLAFYVFRLNKIGRATEIFRRL